MGEWGGGVSQDQKRRLIQNENDHRRRPRSFFSKPVSFIVLSKIFF
jgi:hypothetical protein